MWLIAILLLSLPAGAVADAHSDYRPPSLDRQRTGPVVVSSPGGHGGARPAQAPAAASSTAGFQEFVLPEAKSYPAQIAVDAQGRVWFTERDGNRIGRFEPGSAEWTELSIPTPDSQPWGLAVDPRGNVWFAETAGNQIGVVDATNDTIREYAIPTRGSRPWGVAVGGDGQVFFTERAGNKIGRLDPATGTIVEYPLPTADAQPSAIAVHGSYVWFTETAANRLGRLNSATGSIIDFRIPTEASSPQDVVVAGGGSPWLTQTTANRISMFAAPAQHTFREIDVAMPDSEPYGIALDSKGAVWFTERAGNRLGRYAGMQPPSEYALPTADSYPHGLAVDGNDCVWYTAPRVNQIGRFCLLPPSAYVVYLPHVRAQAADADLALGLQLFEIEDPVVERVDQAGAAWVRIPLNWSQIEPVNTTPQYYQWPADLDRHLANLSALNIKPILTLSGNPRWAATFPGGPIDQVTISELVEFMQAAVAHYSIAPYYVRQWELYNEPDNTWEIYAASGGFGLFGAQPAEYVRILKAVYAPMKAVDPDAQILFGGVAYDNWTSAEIPGPFAEDFVDRVLELGGGDHFDVMNFHYYPLMAPNWAAYGIDIIGKATALRQKMASYGVTKPMVCTEVSQWSDAFHGGSEELQSRYVPQAYARSLVADLEILIWFWLVDRADPESWHYGLLNPDLSPKPGYFAYQTLAQQLSGAVFVAPQLSDLIEAYEFSPAEGGQSLVVAWSRDEQNHPFSLHAAQVVLIDKFGGEVTIQDADDGMVDGQVQVSLGPSPVYLRFGP